MSLQEASKFEGAMQIVEERVKPERMKYKGKTARDRYLREKWWLFRGYRSELAEFCRTHERYLALSVVSKYVAFRFVDSNFVATAATTCILTSDDAIFAQLQSSVHDVWARYHGSSLGGTLRYIAGRCFKTYPLLKSSPQLREIGADYNNWREEVLRQKSISMTEIYNRMHQEEDRSAAASEMRDFQVALDLAVMSAHDWSDLDLEHGFHEVPYLPENDRIRFTMSETARSEVIRRLSDLNKQHDDDQRNVEKSKAASVSKRSNRAQSRRISDQSELSFDAPRQEGWGPTDNTKSAADKILSHLKARRSWLSKSDILAYVDILDGQWNAAINDLLARGTVERQGERRSARYRISESD